MIKALRVNYFVYFIVFLLSISCKTRINTTQDKHIQNASISKSEVLSANKFKEEINLQKGVLVDVRTPQEYNNGHLKNAILINFLGENFKEQIKQFNKDQPVYLYCKSGNRSAKAAQALKEEGFKEVYELKGGIKAWEEAGLPTVK